MSQVFGHNTHEYNQDRDKLTCSKCLEKFSLSEMTAKGYKYFCPNCLEEDSQ